MQQRQRNPWKILGLAVAIGVPALLVTGAVVGMVEEALENELDTSELASAATPPEATVDECNRYALLVDLGETGAKSGQGAEASAAADEAAPADSAYPQGVGTVVGLSEQNRRSPLARAAYRDCMARKGYAS